MDICYYYGIVHDELHGAKDYFTKAINCKKIQPDHAQYYYKMALAEMDHASYLIKMFEDDYAKCTEKLEPIPDIYPSSRAMLNELYTDKVAKLKAMQQIYDSK